MPKPDEEKKSSELLKFLLEYVPARPRAWLVALSLYLLLLPLAVAAFAAVTKDLPWYVSWSVGGLAVALLIGLGAAVYSYVTTTSRVAVPDTFNPDLPESGIFFGRSSEVDEICKSIAANPFVKLTGESGAGKSAIIKNCLLEVLRSGESYFPVYVESWGDSWNQGPVDSLFASLRTSLLEPWAPRPDNGSVPAVTRSSLFDFLARFETAYHRVPVIILDQLDDYLVSHWHRLRGSRGELLSAEAVSSSNFFWRRLFELVSQGSIRLLIATSAEFSDAAQSVERQPPRVVRLSGLSAQYLDTLLDQLTSAVANPAAGWDRLRQQLRLDLAQSKFVLPIRIAFAIRGLPHLQNGELTTAAYKKMAVLRA